MDGIDSMRRSRPAEESLAVWKEMVAGSPDGQRHCMRFKISMQASRPAWPQELCSTPLHTRTARTQAACACRPGVFAAQGCAVLALLP